MTFSARTVIVGSSTPILIVPHIGEFDQAALFSKRLDYEKPVFEWLEARAVTDYETIIEIGANIGIYSVFFNALINRHPAGKLKRIIAFEPAYEPFCRLLQNLSVNGAGLVIPFRAAISDVGGFRKFFEPRGHLTNGSFDGKFARIFTTEVEETVVLTCGVDELGCFFSDNAKALVKIDVEGHEATLITAMENLIDKYHPDLLIEVLPGTDDVLNAAECLRGYERFLITPAGLERRAEVAADASHRDWLLKCMSRGA